MLSDLEQERDHQQRRQSDSWMQIKNLEIQHRNATLTAVATVFALVLSGSWWLSGKSADEKVGPLRNRVVKLEAVQSEFRNNFHSVDKKQDKMLDLLIEMGKGR